jgi:hypothetical protein
MSSAAGIPGSAGCQPAAFGSLPIAKLRTLGQSMTTGWRQAAANNRLAAFAPKVFVRESSYEA